MLLRNGKYRTALSTASVNAICKNERICSGGASIFEPRYKPTGYPFVPRISRGITTIQKGIPMKNQFHHTVNDLKSQPMLAITHALRRLDAGFDALEQSVRTKISAPTLILTQAEHFKTLIPQCMHDCPAFVLWLPTTFTGDILDLAHVEPTVYGRSAPDLKKRDLMMS